ACFFQVLLQLGQGFPGEGGDLGVFGAGSPLEQFDGLLVGVDLIVGVGGVEGLAVTGLQDQGLGLVHQGGFVRHFQPLVRCQLVQLVVAGDVVLEHAFGEGANVIVLVLFQRLLGGFDPGDALGGGVVDAVFSVDAVAIGVGACHFAIDLIAVAVRTSGLGA